MTNTKDQPKRTCVECKHWRVDGTAQGCDVGHWYRAASLTHHLRAKLLMGRICPDLAYADDQYAHPQKCSKCGTIHPGEFYNDKMTICSLCTGLQL